MKILYEAIDGEIFNNEDECLTYESYLKAESIKDKTFLWDEDKDPIEVNGSVFTNFDKVMYFHCSTEESFKIIFNILEEDGYTRGLTFPGDGITWMWNESSVKWQPVDYEIDALQDKIAELRNLQTVGTK